MRAIMFCRFFVGSQISIEYSEFYNKRTLLLKRFVVKSK